MDKTALVERNIEDGRSLVSGLDDAGFPVRAALWLYLSDSDDWRFIIASLLADKIGPRQAYESVQSVLAGLSPPVRVSLKEISVVSPNDPLILLLGQAIHTGSGISGIRFARNTINGTFIEDAYIYRLS